VAVSNAQSSSTCHRILDAAERLFAEKGFDATSIRDITTEADCNLAAVNYHFGGKDRLYLEAFRRLLVDLRDRRIAMMREDMENTADPTLESFLLSFSRAFMHPFVEGGRGRFFMVFISREMVDPHVPKKVFVTEFVSPLLEVSLEGLLKSVPDLDEVSARRCVMSVVGQLLHTLGARHHLMSDEEPGLLPSDLDEHIQHIVKFSAAGIRACADAAERKPC
jgi:AcrR family transcriptional regulator